MNDWKKLIRPQVAGFEPYVPGRSMESVRRERGLKRIIKLASNENALGPSAKALRALQATAKNVFRYPDGASSALRLALAHFYKVDSTRVMIGAGSDELIELLGKTFLNTGDSIVVSEHAFVRYQMAAEMMGATPVRVPMRHMTHDLAAMAAAIRADTKIVFIANPNNPTGTYNSAQDLEQFLRQVHALNQRRSTPVLVVVDEAYYEYAKAFAKDYPDTLTLQKQFPFVMVLRTYSKAHALAGLRIGYGFAEPAVIDALDRVRPPFNVSIAAQAAGVASLQDQAHIRRSIQLVRSERKKLTAELDRLGVRYLPSIANFLLLDIAPRRGREVFEALLDRGIITRAMDEYGFPQHLRVTYGLPSENRAFMIALKEVLTS